MADRVEVDMIVKAVSQGFDKVSKDVKDVGGAAETAGKSAKSSSVNLATLGAALGAVTVAAVATYKALKEGAALELSRTQFDNLAGSINTTADALLGKMREATKGMIADSELIASGAQIISLGLAKTDDDVTRLAAAVGTLGLDMQQVIMTFANNSVMRLDALGLSVEDVTKKAEQLKAEGFTGDAFDEAVLIGLEEKMRLLGDTSETSAGKIATFEASWKNLADGMKLWLVDAAMPTIDALTTIMNVNQNAASTIDGIVDANIAGASSAADIVTQYKKVTEQLNRYGGLAAAITGTTDDLQRQQQKLASALVDVSSSGDEYIAAMKEMGLVGSNMGQTSEATARAFYEEQKAAIAVERALADIAQTAASADSVMLSYMTTTTDTGESTWNLSDALERAQKKWDDARDAADEHTGALGKQRDALLLLREEQENLVAATGDYFTAAVNAGNEALVTWNRTVTTSGGLTNEQKANLEELSGAYERTQDNIRSLQGGTDGLGLTEDELNKKLGEQYEALGLIEAAMGPLQGITSDVTGVTEGWAYNQAAINDELYRAADAAGASATELALLGLAAGQMTPQMAEAALKAAAVSEKVRELGEAIRKGMDPQVALNHLQTFQAGLDAQDFTVRLGIDAEPIAKDSGKIKEAVQPTIEDLGTAVDDLGLDFVNMQQTATGQFEELDTSVLKSKTDAFDPLVVTVGTLKDYLFGLPTEINIRVNYQTTGTLPEAGGGYTPPPGGGYTPPPGSSAPASSGGYGPSMAGASMGAGGRAINISFAGAVFQGMPAEQAAQVAGMVAEQIGRL